MDTFFHNSSFLGERYKNTRYLKLRIIFTRATHNELDPLAKSEYDELRKIVDNSGDF